MPLLIRLLIPFCAAIHVAEEFGFGWISWANQFIKGVTRGQFWFWNALFIALCSIGIPWSSALFNLSLASLLLLNFFVHLLPTLVQRKYSPGLISAALLYLPLGISSYLFTYNHALVTKAQILYSVLLGGVWMSAPFLYQVARMLRAHA